MRLLTLNLLHGGFLPGLRERRTRTAARLAVVLDELRQLQPDVIALQEALVTRAAGATALRLAEALGYAVRFAPANPRILPPALAARVSDRVGGGIDAAVRAALDFEEGTAILTRLPILAHGIHPLPRPLFALENRVAVRVRLETEVGQIDIWSVHLTRVGGGHRRQAAALATMVLREASGLPAVVLGDFNAEEHARAMHVFRRSGFRDAYRLAHPSTAGATAWQRVTSKASTVTRRVDHCLLTAQGTLRVLRSEIVLDRPGTCKDGRPLWPSDHRGLLTEIVSE